LIYHRNEVIHFLRVTKVPRPYLKLNVLLLDLLYQIGKEKLHVILHRVELGDFRVGVLVKDVLYFAPFHFLACFMEKSTLLSIVKSTFTDEARLTALGIYTNHKAMIAIDTLREVFEVFACHWAICLFYSFVNKYYKNN
jgi:hypothetical protein